MVNNNSKACLIRPHILTEIHSFRVEWNCSHLGASSSTLASRWLVAICNKEDGWKRILSPTDPPLQPSFLFAFSLSLSLFLFKLSKSKDYIISIYNRYYIVNVNYTDGIKFVAKVEPTTLLLNIYPF